MTPSMTTPILETKRLILRPPVLEDFEPWAAMMAEPETHFIGGPQVRADVWRSMMFVAGSWALQGYSLFSVIEKQSGRWIGRIGPLMPEGWPGTEVGWCVTRDVYGRGYAPEAAAAAIDWAFDALGWEEVIHCIDPANANSQAVARKLGSRILRQGMLPAPINKPTEIWGQSRQEWRSRGRS
jgi:RimJ/RimL family protein N-acetyltransferase